MLAGAARRLLRHVPSLGVSSPNASSLNGLETRPGDYRTVYSVIELVHLYGDGSKMVAPDGGVASAESLSGLWTCRLYWPDVDGLTDSWQVTICDSVEDAAGGVL